MKSKKRFVPIGYNFTKKLSNTGETANRENNQTALVVKGLCQYRWIPLDHKIKPLDSTGGQGVKIVSLLTLFHVLVPDFW
jgi:hypothetical protein